MSLTCGTFHRPRGMTILEVMIALFVFAIGILSVAGLQISSRRAGYEALQRTTAALLANDILERMQANPKGLAAYVDETPGALRPVPDVDCRLLDCSPEQLAFFDTWEWQQSLLGVAEQHEGNNAGGLVNPTGCISGSAFGEEGIYTVTIAWQGSDELANSNPSTCGSGKSTAGEYGSAYEYRRLIEVAIYLVP